MFALGAAFGYGSPRKKMTMQETTVVDVFSEVDDELRSEKLKKLWKKTGPFVIGGAVLFIAAMGGRVYWQDYVIGQRIQESERYQAAVSDLEAGRDAEALAGFEGLIASSKYGYGLLSRLQKAANLATSGDIPGAISAYDAISADTGLTQRFREYGALMAVLILIDQGGTEEAYERLAPLVKAGSNWYYSANEALALMYFSEARYQEAEEIFLRLAVDPATPPDLKNRAGEFMQMIENKKPAGSLLKNKTEEEPAS